MGRHSSTRQLPYYLSVVGWFLPWAVIALVLGAAVWIAVGVGGRGLEATETSRSESQGDGDSGTGAPAGEPDGQPPGGNEDNAPAGGTKQESPAKGGGDRGDPPARNRTPDTTEKSVGDPAGDKSVDLLTEGFPIQVLNASTSAAADNAMADRLTGLGFTVASVVSASRPYDATTVYWSYPGAERAATRLARRFGWTAAPKPVNLSPEVAMHVVVGNDAT
ncbi:MAG: LytR C-terminal domain-containing protein [Actinobacteria bacterium]|nr:LytR C-terminal domain-containing protein [Actinomycetota bacterium]